MKKIFLFLKKRFEDPVAFTIAWTKVFFVVLSLFLFSGCMMGGMKMGRNMMNTMMGKSTNEVQRINSSQVIDKMT